MAVPLHPESSLRENVLQAYLLGCVEFEKILTFQRRLVFEVSGARESAFLILCEHPEGITMGREASAGHLLFDSAEDRFHPRSIRWVNRGGGCLLHAPGQVSVYAVLALDPTRLNLQEYLDRLHRLIRKTLIDLEVPAELRANRSGVWVGDRKIAQVGIAVRDWVAYFGFTLNVDPDLECFRWVKCDGEPRPMTSIERERRLPIRPGTVRQRIVEGFQDCFEFDRVSVFHHHPILSQKVVPHAVVKRPA